MRIEADDLQAAYEKAASELNCSVTQLDVVVLQAPSSGFLGFFKKNAIIEAEKIVSQKFQKGDKLDKFERKKEQKKEKSANDVTKSVLEKKKTQKKQHHKDFQKKNEFDTNLVFKNDSELVEVKKTEIKHRNSKDILDVSIIDTFNKNDFYEAKNDENLIEQKKEIKQKDQKKKRDIEEILPEIKNGLIRLFDSSDFKISKIEVEKFDDDTVLIELDGEDAALLIGKEGYRYKAISYLLYNWINSKYNIAIRLEIAQFLKNQEAGMDQYLQGVIQRVQSIGKAKTKPLDGVLVKIALEKLRSKFPDKYVSIKNGNEGQFVVVNDFLKK